MLGTCGRVLVKWQGPGGGGPLMLVAVELRGGCVWRMEGVRGPPAGSGGGESGTRGQGVATNACEQHRGAA